MSWPGMAPSRRYVRRFWPELLLCLFAACIFLGSLGSPELWGKREQRAAAEALDTVQNGRWLVAQIQGRPRLEKPPLPRWAAAALLSLSGRRDEWVVRLPGALSGLTTVLAIYLLGARIGGRSLAMTSALALCTTGLFIAELRQAGNDGPLGCFTSLALLAAWCRIHDRSLGHPPLDGAGNDLNCCRKGSRYWTLLFHGALGLGFLCKGPIILALVGWAIVPYLACTQRLKSGLRALIDPVGLLLFFGLAACWPVLVLLDDPGALGVWITEMGQKTGMLPIAHRGRTSLELVLPALGLPWPVAGLSGVLLPLFRRGLRRHSWVVGAIWFPWWWFVGNLAMFQMWAVAKPNYLVPCMPGEALLIGMAWIHLSRAAHDRCGARQRVLARLAMFLQWAILLLCCISAVLLGHVTMPSAPRPVLALLAVTASCGVAVGFWIWKRGLSVLSLLPVTATCALGVIIGYGFVAPYDNLARGHRHLAEQLESLLPPGTETLHFFHEIDEGLWFYLRQHRLAPVPGSQARYSDSHDRLSALIGNGPVLGLHPEPPATLLRQQKPVLLEWLRQGDDAGGFLVMRASLYDQMTSELAGLVSPLYREPLRKRNSLVLLRRKPVSPLSSPPARLAGLPIACPRTP
ncbi:MAG: glycosyltransferase family 39 protein [Planctomycetaceae bacterium]|nr:glycosyltransferase family 39 protein [Planctomycetaceae bacterium]